MNNDLFGNTAAERHADKVVETVDRVTAVVVLGAGKRVSCRHAARDDGDLLHVVVVLTQLCKNRMARLMVGGRLLIGLGDDAALLLRAHRDLVDAFIELEIADELLSCTRRQNRGLVEEIRKVCAREAARHARENLEVYVGRKRLIARMDLQNLFTTLNIWQIDIDLTVKSARTEKGVIENVCTVGGRHDDDPFVGLKAVHLHEDLVQGLLAFIVSATEPRTALTSHRIDLIDEDDTGLVLLREIK